MRRAAGIATVAEQQLAQQQQAEAEKLEKREQMQAMGAMKDKEMGGKMAMETMKGDQRSAQQQERIESQAAAKQMSPATMGAPAQ